MAREKYTVKGQDQSELQGNPKSRQFQGQLNTVQQSNSDKGMNLGYIP